MESKKIPKILKQEFLTLIVKEYLHFTQIKSLWCSSILAAVMRTTVPDTLKKLPTSSFRGKMVRCNSGHTGKAKVQHRQRFKNK